MLSEVRYKVGEKSGVCGERWGNIDGNIEGIKIWREGKKKDE